MNEYFELVTSLMSNSMLIGINLYIIVYLKKLFTEHFVMPANNAESKSKKRLYTLPSLSS